MVEVDREYEGDWNKAILASGIPEDTITQAKAAFYKLPYQKIDSTKITQDTIKYIPEDAARHYKFVPIAFTEDVLSIGVTEPENIESMNALQFIS
ncbi:hypothetical protein K2Q02_00100, partial [Patescibacteria group bacterium]|nr:hypothetical protein [Patescibacteria group bacterium]